MSDLQTANNVFKKTNGPSIFSFIHSPSEQFTIIKQCPKLLAPFLIILLLYSLAGMISAFGTDINWLVTQTDVDDVELVLQMESFYRGMIFIGVIFVPIFGSVFLSFLYLVIAKIVHSTAKFQHFLSMNLFIFFISGLGVLLNNIVITMFNFPSTHSITSLEGIFQLGGIYGIFLKNIDVFTIWTIILTTIGLKKVADFTGALALSSAIGLTVIPMFFQVVGLLIN